MILTSGTKHMKRKTLWTTLILLCLAAPAAAQINGLHENPRFFNDFPGSTLTITNGNSVNLGAGVSEVNIHDTDFTPPGGFANRHDVLLSSDGGASNHVFDIDDSFTVKAEVTLTDGFDAPRKETGIRINSPVTGDVLFLVNSDAGEIVAFGGGAPFHLFGNNGGGDGYTPGDTILMGISVAASGDGPGGAPNRINYFIDRHDGMGIIESGFQAYSNLELGSTMANVGFYAQVQPDPSTDFINANFNDIMYSPVPEPAALGLIALALLGFLIGRRRN